MAQKLVWFFILLACVACTSAKSDDKNLHLNFIAKYGAETTCVELQSYLQALAEIENLEFVNAQAWVNRLLPERAETLSYRYSDGLMYASNWFENGSNLQIVFQDDLFYSIEIPLNIYAVDATDCLGTPEFYQAYEGPKTLSLHGSEMVLKVGLIYEGERIAIEGYQNSIVFKNPTALRMNQLRYWHDGTPQENLANGGRPVFSHWHPEEWRTLAIKPWSGWDEIAVIPYLDLQERPAASVMATQTAIAPLIRTTPTFPIAQAADSAACKTVLNPSLITLDYGHTTLEQARTILITLDPQLDKGASALKEGDSEQGKSLAWSLPFEGPPSEQSAYFNNGILEYAQVNFLVEISTATVFDCFGQPERALLTTNSLYLYFPAQGVVTEAYFPQNEELLNGETLIQRMFFTTPATNGVALETMTAPFIETGNEPAWVTIPFQ